jgi:hypothetical protein
MTFYELLKRVYWALDEWIASSLGLGDYYGADEADNASDKNEDDEDPVDEVADEDDEDDEDDEYDDMYKYHDHQA